MHNQGLNEEALYEIDSEFFYKVTIKNLNSFKKISLLLVYQRRSGTLSRKIANNRDAFFFKKIYFSNIK